jgi:hypothetical protein
MEREMEARKAPTDFVKQWHAVRLNEIETTEENSANLPVIQDS